MVSTHVRIALTIAAALLLYWALRPNPEQQRREAIDTLTARRAEIRGELVRSRADCDADRTEFPDVPEVLQTCMEGHKAIVMAADDELRDIDKRLQELRAP